MSWTDTQLVELILELRARRGDFTEVEVKRGSEGVPRCAETLCAFGNMPAGGTIVIGLDEARDFAATGVQSVADIESGVAAQARTAVQPPVAVAFQLAHVGGADIVVANVAGLPSHQRPCRTGGRAYLRQADGDYVMSEQEIQQMLALRERPRYDAAVIEATTTEDLDRALTATYLSSVRASSRRLSDVADGEVLARKAVQRGAHLTTGGTYALGRFPQEFEPSLSVTAAVQLSGESGERTRDLQHMDGPLPELLSQAMEWVRRNTQTTIRVGADGHARDASEIPMVAVRELVANALVHRDLGPHTRGKRVEIRLLDDKLVISNPGGLYGVTSEQLGKPGGKSAVNEFLYDICKYVQTSDGARVIEGEGGGIREVERSLRAAGLAPPHFVDKGISFTVVVPRHALLPAADIAWLRAHPEARRLSSIEAQILVSMRHGQSWTNAMVRQAFTGTDSREAHKALQHLVDLDLAEAIGERGGRSYRLHADQDQGSRSGGRPDVVIAELSPEFDQDPLPELAAGRWSSESGSPVAGGQSSQHSAVLRALAQGPLAAKAIAGTSGLSIDSVRYALRRLVRDGAVVVHGGQGVRGTTYEVTPSVAASTHRQRGTGSGVRRVPGVGPEVDA